MKLKTEDVNGTQYAVIQDGKPVYVKDDGSEVAFDAPGTIATISRLNGEAKGHREAKEAAETRLKAFEGITDPKAAIEALGKLKSLDDKKLIDAGEVEKVKAEAIKAVEEKYKPIVEENEKLKGDLYSERVGGQFARSKFIAEKCAVPADILQARFGTNFKDEDGKAVAYDGNGNKIYSKSNPGEPAAFDEALEILLDGYAYKDSLLKGTGGGSGAKGSTASGGGGAKTMTRSEFDAMSQADRIAKFKDGFKVVDAA